MSAQSLNWDARVNKPEPYRVVRAATRENAPVRAVGERGYPLRVVRSLGRLKQAFLAGCGKTLSG